MLGDLVRHVLRPTGDLPLVRRPRPDPGRAFGLELRADDRALPLAVAVEPVDVREDLLGRTRDLDAVRDHGAPRFFCDTVVLILPGQAQHVKHAESA